MTQDTRLTAAKQFGQHVTALAKDYVTTMFSEERGRELAGQFALAFREAAIGNPDLYRCRPEEIAWAVARCAMTGLKVGGPLPEVDLIVRKGRLNWQVSSRGWVTLAERAGWMLQATPVYWGDHFEEVLGLHPNIIHRPDRNTEQSFDTLRCVYVVARPISSPTMARFVVMSKAQIEKRRNVSDAWRAVEAGNRRTSPWHDWPIEMAEKTALSYAVRRRLVPLNASAEVGLTFERPPTESVDLIEPAEVHTPAEPRPGVAGVDDALAAAGRERARVEAISGGTDDEPDEPLDPEARARAIFGDAEVDSAIADARRMRAKRVTFNTKQHGALTFELPDGEAEPEVVKRPPHPSDVPPGPGNAETPAARASIDAEEQLERERLLAQVRELEGHLGPEIRDEVRKSFRPHIRRVRDNMVIKKLAEYARRLQARKSEEEAKLPPEPLGPEEKQDEPWTVREIETSLRILTREQRVALCQEAQVKHTDDGSPMWHVLNFDQQQRLGNLVDDRLTAMETSP